MVYDTDHRTAAQLTAYVDDIIFPCSRRELLECAEDNEAPDLILDAIETLPDRRYWSLREILARIRGTAEESAPTNTQTPPPRTGRQSAQADFVRFPP